MNAESEPQPFKAESVSMSSEEVLKTKWWEQPWYLEWCRMAGIKEI